MIAVFFSLLESDIGRIDIAVAIGVSQYLVMIGQQSNLLLNFPCQCLIKSLSWIDSALGKLPGIFKSRSFAD